MKKLTLILNYHQIISDEEAKKLKEIPLFCVKQSDFIEQLSLIKKNKTPVISLSDWKAGKSNTNVSIILTFDDGNKSDFEIAFKELLKEKIHGSFFPTLCEIGNKGRVNWKQLRKMSEEGFLIGSHGINHKSLLRMNNEERIREITTSKLVIEEKINKKIDAISLPYGMYNNNLISLIKKVGYKSVLTTRVKNNVSIDALLLHRMNIKSDTSPKEFEEIITLHSGRMKRKKFISNISFLVNKLFGVSWINILREKF